jgi:hypothetical protein
MGTTTRALILIAALAFLAGCNFENPLTSHPTKDLNTWLLGVWEYKDEKGIVHKATVTPKTGDRYWVNVQTLGTRKSAKKVYVFEAWISRVGNSSFLTLQALETSGDIPLDGYSFVHFQVLDQNNVRIRVPQLGSDASATSYELRKEIRTRLKDGSLYSEERSDWTRVSEVYWSTGDEPQPFQPLRFPEDSVE